MANAALEVIQVSSRSVSCDGGGGAMGHPKVYLQIKPDETTVVCPYCSRTFELEKKAR